MSMEETLRKQIQDLETDIAELEESIKAKASKQATTLARMQARLFLEKIFAPYMDGLCETWGVSPEEGLRILIREEDTFDKIAADNPVAVKELMNQREMKIVVDIASPLENVSDDWIKDKMTVLLEVMEDVRPELANALVTTPGGQTWFYDSLVGLRNILIGRPQLKY